VQGVLEYEFDPDSLYTLTTTAGQGKGTAQPPPEMSFPLPYADDFENTPIQHTPKYLSDQDGAFEVHACDGRAGQCLQQVITKIPIPWGPLPDPFSLAGDANWRDYAVAAEVHFLTEAPGVVMGRIDSSDVFRDSHALFPSGYVLRLKPNGAWELLSAQYKMPVVTLAAGTANIDRSSWHCLELRFRGKQIAVSLDGDPLASVEDETHTHGMFALGTGWNLIQYDNLHITP
jgi:hypothetical protein